MALPCACLSWPPLCVDALARRAITVPLVRISDPTSPPETIEIMDFFTKFPTKQRELRSVRLLRSSDDPRAMCNRTLTEHRFASKADETIAFPYYFLNFSPLGILVIF